MRFIVHLQNVVLFCNLILLSSSLESVLILILLLLQYAVLAPMVPIIGYRAVLGLSGYVLNNIAFVFAAFYLYRSVLLLYRIFSEVQGSKMN